MPKKRPFLDITNKTNNGKLNKSKNTNLKRHLTDDPKEIVEQNIKKLKTINRNKDEELFEIFENSLSSDKDDIIIIEDIKTKPAANEAHKNSNIQNNNIQKTADSSQIEVLNSSFLIENKTQKKSIPSFKSKIEAPSNTPVSNPIPTTELIKQLKEKILSNRKENLDYNPVDLCPAYKHYDLDNRANLITTAPFNSVVSEDEESELVRFTNVDDLRLRQPVRAPNKQIFNRNVSFEEDLKRLTSKMFPILEKKPDENKFDMSKFKLPKGILVPLMDHQCRSLEWLKWREESFPHGAILADDMGLGKTLTILAYLKQLKDEKNHDDSSDDEEATIIDENNNEIKSESEEDEVDFSNFSNINVEKLTKRIFQNTSKIKKHISNRLKTLIVLPASLLHQWQTEIKTRFEKNSFRYEVYHGPDRKELTKSQLEQCDIVFTTYEIVSREADELGKGTVSLSKSPIARIEWTRIICDEGHRIKNSSSISNQAMCSLKAKYRIVITGTPIHNSMCDLYSLLKFINLYPLNDKSLFTYLFPSNKKTACTVEEERRTNCWIHFLSSFLLLRRTKLDKIKGTDKNIVDLPKKSVELIKFDLIEPERYIYDQIFKESKEKVKTLLINQRSNQFYKNSYGEVNFSDVLVYILRLRQSCCHMNLIHQVVDMDHLKNLQDEFIELLDDEKTIPSSSSSSSHSNRTRFKSLRSIEENPELAICFKETHLSSKFKIMMEKLDKILDEHPNDKIIIVSQWTSVLKIMANNLRENSVEFCEINGQVDLFERNRIVEYFNEKKHMDIRVMLLSLCAGGVGLNLIGANHMFLFDIHWNPALESQASDRIYRVGQTKDVKIYKFLCQNTIEESIYQVQLKKIDLAERFVNAKASNIPGMASAGNARLTVQDLRMLFELI